MRARTTGPENSRDTIAADATTSNIAKKTEYSLTIGTGRAHTNEENRRTNIGVVRNFLQS